MPRLLPASARPWSAGAALALCALAARPLDAQFSAVPAPGAYALRGVTVVGADGRRTPNVTVVVRDGRIAAMAPDAAIPAGARVLEGDSLMVYPGLVDAQGAAKFSFPEAQVDRAQLRSWAPPRALQTFTPHRRVADALTATGKDLAGERKKGIVAAAVHPEAGLMTGQGAVLVLRPHAELPGQLVVNPAAGQLFGFRGGRGVYPGTMFGVTAFQRQALEDAKRTRAIAASYARQPSGAAMPAADPDYAALERVLAGESRVFFVASDAGEIRRALTLGDQYGFVPVIVGGQEAWKVADELKRRDATVLVSLDVPKPRRWKPPTDGAPIAGPVADSAKARGAADDAFVQRERQDYEAVFANPGKLAAAGVRFALTSGGGKADLREGARTAMRYGLSEIDALRALTTTPAALLGVAPVLRVSVGAPATFVVTDGPLFDKDARVVYTFVEGAMETGGAPAARGAGAAAANGAGGMAAVAGSWDVELSSPQGTLTGTMRLTPAGDAFGGTIASEFGDLPVRDGKVNGSAVTFTVTFPFMQNASVVFTGTREGDRLTGTAPTPMGDISWSAKRSGPPGPGLEREREEDLWEGHAHGPPAPKRAEPAPHAPHEPHAPPPGREQ